jgi:hypothetical protein
VTVDQFDTSPEGRRAYLDELNSRMDGRSLIERLAAAERDVAGCEEDLHQAVTQLSVTTYAVTHTEDGRERSVSEEGSIELVEAQRVEFRTRQRYEAALAELHGLLSEYDLDLGGLG